MNDNKIKARKEFYIWFEENICMSCDFDDNNITNDTIDKISEKMYRLCKKYTVDEKIFENVLYELDHGKD